VWRVGIRSDYRRHFWDMARGQLAQGHVETMFQVAMVAHHLITHARECTRGLKQASNYSFRRVEAARGRDASGGGLSLSGPSVFDASPGPHAG
jgi:hypothetical protein